MQSNKENEEQNKFHGLGGTWKDMPTKQMKTETQNFKLS